nr:MAG: hypothetical protein [Bacteriophage sp.]
MKRYSGLHDKLCTIENIEVADDNARKNKNKKYGINKHDKNRQYIDLIIFLLILKLLNMIGVFILKNRKENIKPQI